MFASSTSAVTARRARWNAAKLALSITLLITAVTATAARAETNSGQASDLNDLSIEQLANIDIYSVAKTSQPLSDAPAAIYVISHDDVIRTGVASLPDMLRLAPNLQVAQVTASSYAITARGFNSTAADKLLVLIDGRSVYTPFISGVSWDAQSVLPDDVDRIEVVSGPGATLWGANAVNGVINIVTRKASDTQGGLATLSLGNLQRGGSLQYGGRIGSDVAWRAYLEGRGYSQDVTAAGAPAKDDWWATQGGFRVDWTPGRDLVTVQGDIYTGSEDQLTTPKLAINGHNLLARWTHPMDNGASLQIQTYYDYLSRSTPTVATDTLSTFDVEAQYSFALGERQQIVTGAGARVMSDRFIVVPGNVSNPLTQFFNPESRVLTLGDAFLQDTLKLVPAVSLTLGVKLENDPYVGLQTLPSARLSWKVDSRRLLWAAISRAIRAPSRFDRDFFETSGATLVLRGANFHAETLVAYELGYRAEPSPRAFISISAFYNVYHGLRSVELSPGGVLPASIGNMMDGDTYGLEVWGSYQATERWRLSAGANWLHESLRFEPGSFRLGGLALAGDDPAYQVQVRSTMNLAPAWVLDLDLRGVGPLPNPASPAYVELNGRLAWTVSDALEIALVGVNLLHDHHLEFGSTTASLQLGRSGLESGRGVSVDARVRF